MKEILEKVLNEAKPDEEEREKLSKTSEKLIKDAKEVGSSIGVSIEPKLVGSSARGTWISGERDIDIFLLFPKDTPRKELEEKGLEIGKKISEEEGSEQYAEHPYIRAEINGFDVDIVPCYDIDDPSKIRSAVDRSPHHQEYVKEKLTSDLKDEVLLLKKFLKGIGAYGSELKVHGFSGYLCELLMIHYKSFENLIKSVKDWKSEKIITLNEEERSKEDLKILFPDQPLIFVDPVDPGRNVGAAVSKNNYATLIRACQDFSRNPKEEFFSPKKPPSSEEKILNLINSRETKIFLISLNIPFELVPDILYPQLRKTKRKLVNSLEDSDYEVLRSGVWAKNKKAIILLELKTSKLPTAKKHLGPPLDVDAKPFIQEHLNSENKLAGPFINKEGRLVFELKREQTRAKDVLQNVLKSAEGFGKHIKKSIEEEGFKISEDEKIVTNAENLNALKFLGDYLTRCLPWYR